MIYSGYLTYDAEENEIYLLYNLDKKVPIAEGRIAIPNYTICKVITTGSSMCPIDLIRWEVLLEAAKAKAKARYSQENKQNYLGCGGCKH